MSTTRQRYHNLPNPDFNNVTGVWPGMEKCVNLTAVELTGNGVTEMPDISKNGGTLKTLSAAQNRITYYFIVEKRNSFVKFAMLAF